MTALIVVAAIWIALRLVTGAWLPRVYFRDPKSRR